METALALPYLAPGRQQGVGEGADLLFRLAQQVQGQPLGRARTDAGQPFELLNQPGQGARKAAQESAAGGANLGAIAGGGPQNGATRRHRDLDVF